MAQGDTNKKKRLKKGKGLGTWKAITSKDGEGGMEPSGAEEQLATCFALGLYM